MKRLVIILFCLCGMTLFAQVQGNVDDMIYIRHLNDTLRTSIPYRDSLNHITITKAELSVKNKNLWLTVVQDYGTGPAWRQDSVARYLAWHAPWILAPLVGPGYFIDMQYSIQDEEKHADRYSFTVPYVFPAAQLADVYHDMILKQRAGEILDNWVVEDTTLAFARNEARRCEESLPIRDSLHGFTISSVKLDTVLRNLECTIRLDRDATTPAKTDVDFQRFLFSNGSLSLMPLALHGYGLVTHFAYYNAKNGISVPVRVYSFSPDELVVTIHDVWNRVLVHDARDLLVQIVDSIRVGLPMQSSDEETLIDVTLSSDSLLITSYFECPDSAFAYYKAYITAHRAEALEYITTRMVSVRDDDVLAYALYYGKANHRKVWFNTSHSDSVDITVAYWMLDKAMSDADHRSQDDQYAYVKAFVNEINSACPYKIDDATTVVGCELDTVNRYILCTYEVTEQIMLFIENDVSAPNRIKHDLLADFYQQSKREFVSNMADAGFSVKYVYTSRRMRRPVVVEFSAEEFREIMNGRMED